MGVGRWEGVRWEGQLVGGLGWGGGVVREGLEGVRWEGEGG